MQFPIGSQVKLADYTGDEQIDEYYDQVLTVSADVCRTEVSHVDRFLQYMAQYELTAADGTTLTVNEYELTAV